MFTKQAGLSGIAITLWMAGVAMAVGEPSSVGNITSAEQLAAELANPLSPITTLTTQLRAEFNNGPADETNYQLRLQPSLFKPMDNADAFLLRTIVPAYVKEWPVEEEGLGDITLIPTYVPDMTRSLFAGYGAAISLPTATDDRLGSKKWMAGPACMVVKTGKPWTSGFLAQQLWSFAGDENRDDISLLTVQPFVTYLIGGGWASTFTSESLYDWEASREAWTVPLSLGVSRIVRIGGLPFNAGLSGVYNIERPAGATESEMRVTLIYALP
jgi:hypothetical protein